MYEKTLSERCIYDGRILRLDVLEIEMENGVQSMRECIRHRGAVAVFCILPDGQVILVRQFRKASEADFEEVVAGLLDEGETPEEAVRRELLEETGYEAADVHFLAEVFSSPGYTNEKIRLFFAELKGERGEQSPDDDEVLEILQMPLTEFERRVHAGEVNDCKTIAAWGLSLPHLQRYREGRS